MPSGVGVPSKGPLFTISPGPSHAASIVSEPQLLALRLDDDLDGDVVLAGELEVALVVGGHGHHGARAVFHQRVVGHPERYLLAVDGVDDVAAGEDALLDQRVREAGHLGLLAGVGDELQHGLLILGAGHEVRYGRVLGSERHEGDAPERVRPRGEARHLLAGVGDLEAYERALAAADPVGLHAAHVLGPGVQQLQVVQQRIGVVGDLEEPLGQVLLDDLGAAALALLVDDFLVGQAGLAARAPVDGRVGAVGEAALVELQEDPLRPLVVVGRAGVDLAVPVVADARAR